MIPKFIMKNDDLVLVTTRVQIHTGSEYQSGTGFFFKENGRTFLITAAHVYGHGGSIVPALSKKYDLGELSIDEFKSKMNSLWDIIHLRRLIEKLDFSNVINSKKIEEYQAKLTPLYKIITDELNMNINIPLICEANGSISERSIIIPFFLQEGLVLPNGQIIDLSVIEITQDIKKLEIQNIFPRISYFERGDILDRARKIPMGQKMLISGFPEGQMNLFNNYPFIYNLTLSSPWNVKIDPRPIFTSTAKLYQGLSGAPIVIPTNVNDYEDLKLVGIHVEGSQYLRINYHVYADAILPLLDLLLNNN